MKRIFALALMVCMSVSVFAQKDPKAREILDRVTRTTQSHPSIEAGFSFTMENKAMNIRETNKGNIVLAGNKYVVKLPDLGVEMYSDGKSVWTFMPDVKEVSIADLDSDSGDMMDPAKIFTIYEHGFGYKYVEESNRDGKAVHVIDLLPEKKGTGYSRIRIFIDKQKMMVSSALMDGEDGNQYQVVINQMKTDGKYADTYFRFDPKKYPGIEVIDMR